jgi:hypothetical protein
MPGVTDRGFTVLAYGERTGSGCIGVPLQHQ